MNMRRVMAYSPHIGTWVPVVAIDIGRPDDTRIATESHPAIIEDAGWDDSEAMPVSVFVPKVEKNVVPGDERIQRITKYLAKRGPSSAIPIALGTYQGAVMVLRVLRGNPQRFAESNEQWGLK